MIRRPPRSTLSSSSAASDVYKRQGGDGRQVHSCRAPMVSLSGSSSSACPRSPLLSQVHWLLIHSSAGSAQPCMGGKMVCRCLTCHGSKTDLEHYRLELPGSSNGGFSRGKTILRF
eukprot:TRINITY_DN869_c0_g1_i4.p1 TRINITY_DN869_c0_g1~~TRINITY_DN869_c0_g1_i4.p1  ORF type:complete len:116 (+),score=9.43 TRINITY_DN869_c0_g1_i4:137-484(+)